MKCILKWQILFGSTLSDYFPESGFLQLACLTHHPARCPYVSLLLLMQFHKGILGGIWPRDLGQRETKPWPIWKGGQSCYTPVPNPAVGGWAPQAAQHQGTCRDIARKHQARPRRLSYWHSPAAPCLGEVQHLPLALQVLPMMQLSQ